MCQWRISYVATVVSPGLIQSVIPSKATLDNAAAVGAALAAKTLLRIGGCDLSYNGNGGALGCGIQQRSVYWAVPSYFLLGGSSYTGKTSPR